MIQNTLSYIFNIYDGQRCVFKTRAVSQMCRCSP